MSRLSWGAGEGGQCKSGSHGPDQAGAGMGRLRQANGPRECQCSAHPQRPRLSRSATGPIRLRAQTSTGPEGKYAPRRLRCAKPTRCSICTGLLQKQNELVYQPLSPRQSCHGGAHQSPQGFGLSGKKEAAWVKRPRRSCRAVCILSVRHAPARENHNGRPSATVPDAAGDGAMTLSAFFLSGQ